MASDIDSYLKELRAALAGADPALVQDALFDAEEHLQAEVAAGGEFATVVEGYGSPEEVAAAYMGHAPRHATPPPSHALLAPAPLSTPDGATLTGETLNATEDTSPAGEVGGAGLTDRASAMATPSPDAERPGATPPGETPPAVGTPPVGVQAGMAAAGATAPPSLLQQIFGVFVDPSVYKALLYMILSLGTGIAYFTVVVTGLSTAGGMLILIVGVPLLLLVLGIVRAMALFEGRLVETLLGTRMPRRLRAEPPGAGFVQRMLFWVKDGRTWASMAYMVLMLPLGVIYFTVAVTGLATGIGLVTAPLWGWFGDRTFIIEGVRYEWLFPVWGIPLAVIAGVIVLVGWLHVVRWTGRGHAAIAKAMLVRLAS